MVCGVLVTDCECDYWYRTATGPCPCPEEGGSGLEGSATSFLAPFASARVPFVWLGTASEDPFGGADEGAVRPKRDSYAGGGTPVKEKDDSGRGIWSGPEVDALGAPFGPLRGVDFCDDSALSGFPGLLDEDLTLCSAGTGLGPEVLGIGITIGKLVILSILSLATLDGKAGGGLSLNRSMLLLL